MAQGDFTKEEAREVVKIVNEMFEALPKNKKVGLVGHLNDILLFLSAAERAAPGNELH